MRLQLGLRGNCKKGHPQPLDTMETDCTTIGFTEIDWLDVTKIYCGIIGLNKYQSHDRWKQQKLIGGLSDMTEIDCNTREMDCTTVGVDGNWLCNGLQVSDS
jgi:hypothetical protein